MEIKIHFTAESSRDMESIREHITTTLGNPSAAEQVADKIISAVERLRIFPEMGAPLYYDEQLEVQDRFLVSGSYMIFYEMIESDVYINRILYGRRNYLKILFPEKEKTEK